MNVASLLGVALSLALATGTARADPPTDAAPDKAACLDAVSKGQRLRDTHKLVEARDQFRICAAASCPAVLQTDCANWLGDLDKTLPTVVLVAKDADGRDAVDVNVNLDGQPLVRSLDGQAVPIDPGMHKFEFVRADGTTGTTETLITEGDKARLIAVVLASPSSHVSLPSLPSYSQKVWAVVAGGVGVVTAGVGFGLAFAAKSADSKASGEQLPARKTDSASAVTEGNIATALVVVGGVLAAGGVVLWFTAPKSPAAVGTNGRELFLRGTF